MWIFVVPVRRRVRFKRERVRRAPWWLIPALFVLALVGAAIEYWTVVLPIAAAYCVWWIVFRLVQKRAARRSQLPESAPSPPLLAQGGSAVRGMASEFMEGYRNGRNGG